MGREERAILWGLVHLFHFIGLCWSWHLGFSVQPQDICLCGFLSLESYFSPVTYLALFIFQIFPEAPCSWEVASDPPEQVKPPCVRLS